VNSLGATTQEVVSALKSGVPSLSGPPPETPFEAVCGRLNDDLPPLEDGLGELDSRNNRLVQRGLLEIKGPLSAALDRWGAKRIGICVGSSTTAMDELEAAYADKLKGFEIPSGPELFARGSAEGLVHVLRRVSGARGPAAIVSNACASSGKAFASAKRWLEAGIVDAVLVGGADSLCQTTLRGFRSLGLLSEEPGRPFCRDRRGINIGEGAAFALLERKGEGPRLLGVGESTDAYHMTSPDPEGRGACAAMEAAAHDARVSMADVGYINAHGTGTLINDAVEARAIRFCLGPNSNALVVSTKGYVGHTLGTAGATEAVFVLESLCGGWIPASAGASPVDPELEINVPFTLCEVDVDVALSNSFAFGGSNVSLAFGAPE
jgi:3-oxoacyl-[acyl-carrier-protein] synthase I